MKTSDPDNTPPEGYNAVSPYLRVADVDNTLEFLRVVFQASIRSRLRSPSGLTWHAEAQIGDTVILIGRAQKAYPATENVTYVWREDVDKTYANALDHGAASVEKPADQFYGIREAGIKDPQGNIWWIAHRFERLTPEEMERRIGEGPPDD